ncbi:uncharacterized protein [Ptychodera flava]|uniref:uncharacterized protein n=1 Tax=Ptychodera flava TaxID=63121 RepID=UPI00396A1375
MLITPIDARERSIEELTGSRPARGTRMYIRQRRSDPDFRDDTYSDEFGEMPIGAPQRARGPKPFRPVSAPKQRVPQNQPAAASASGGDPTSPLSQYTESGMVEGGSTMKPWLSPWEEALQHPAGVVGDTRHAHPMKQYRPEQVPATSPTQQKDFKRIGASVGPHNRSRSMPETPTKPLVKSRELVTQTGGRKARGAVMFDRMKKRSEAFVVDENNVADTTDHYAKMRMQVLQQARPRFPSPPPHVGTGYTPVSRTTVDRGPSKPYKLSIAGQKTPWEAAESNPVGSVEEAFFQSRKPRAPDGSLVQNVQDAARTKAERSAYVHDAWARTPYDDPDHPGQLSFNLAPRVTSVPRVRLGSQPYVNDFNRKPQGWYDEFDGESVDAGDSHSLPRTRHRPPTDFNPRPKSWAPNVHAQVKAEYHYEEHDEEEPVEHLKPVRMTAKKFDRPQYADRRRTRSAGKVRPVAGPKIWNPSMLEETGDL